MSAESPDSVQALMQAAKSGDVEGVRAALANGASINAVDSSRRSALMKACFGGNELVVDLLLGQEGIEVNLVDEDGDSALHDACNQDNKALAEKLLRAGADSAVRNKRKMMAFDLCSSAADITYLKSLVSTLPKPKPLQARHLSPTAAPTAPAPSLYTQHQTALQQITELTSDKEAMMTERASLLVERESHISEINQLKEANRSLTARVERLNSTNEVLEREREHFLAGIASLNQQQDKLVADNMGLQSRLETSENRKSEFERSLNDQIAANQRAEQTRRTLEVEKVDLTRKNKALQDDVARLNYDVQVHKREYLTSQQQLMETASQLDRKTAEHKAATAQLRQTAVIVDDLRAANTLVTTEKASLNSEYERLQHQARNLMSQVAQFRSDQSTIVEENFNMGARVKDLQTRLNQAQEETAQWHDMYRRNEEAIRRMREEYDQNIRLLQEERNKLLADRSNVTTMETQQVSPFMRYRPHVLSPGILPAGSAVGLHDVNRSNPLFAFCKALTTTSGSWLPFVSAIAGFRLIGVQAVQHDADTYAAYNVRQAKLSRLRQVGGDHFNFNTSAGFSAEQLRVLSTLRDQFHERAPGTASNAVNTFYCFHGTRPEHVESVCLNGIVSTRATDAGYFGVGCYSTLNIEYALRYARGDFSEHIDESRFVEGRRYPVIMFAATTAMAYPITRKEDYTRAPNQCDYFGCPLRAGFDSHVICVSQAQHFQAVSREECQYVEVVIEQESSLLALAVLWFEEN